MEPIIKALFSLVVNHSRCQVVQGINATVSGQTVNIGLTTDAQNTISNGIGLLGNVGNTGIKQLKDGNATFDIKGDGSVVKTTASSSGVTIAVDTDKLSG